jgi:hypothetical protein
VEAVEGKDELARLQKARADEAARVKQEAERKVKEAEDRKAQHAARWAGLTGFCPKFHELKLTTTSYKWGCDHNPGAKCGGEGTKSDAHLHCATCKFDVCHLCAAAMKKKVKCSKGHDMIRQSAIYSRDGWGCDNGCVKGQPRSKERYCCKPCGADYCDGCHSKFGSEQKAYAPTPTPKPKVVEASVAEIKGK